MVRVNYPRRSKHSFPFTLCASPLIIICIVILIVLFSVIAIFYPSQVLQEEKQVLNKLYQDEKQVFSHMMHGSDVATATATATAAQADAGGDSITNETPGWKPIHIFYGDDKHLAYLGRQSQVQQDKLIMALLNNAPNGFFIDLAANDATNLSNTYQLEKQLSWNGICIEPNPIYWTSLSHRKCHVVAAVVGKARMEEIRFRMYPDLKKRAPSGGIEGYIDPNILRSKEKPAELYTVPFMEILQKFHAPREIEYLSLDVEGSEFLVMEAFPFEAYIFKVMTIERPNQQLADLLIANNYLYLAANNEDGMETAWIHKSMEGTINRKAIEEIGWKEGATKWISMKDGKLEVNDPRNKKKRGKKN